MSNYTYALQSGMGLGIIPTVNAPYKYTLRKIAAGSDGGSSWFTRAKEWTVDNLLSLYTPPKYEDPRGWTYTLSKRMGDRVNHMGFHDPSHTTPTTVANLVDQNASTQKPVVTTQRTTHARQSSATPNEPPTDTASTSVKASPGTQQGTVASPSANTNPNANQPSQTTSASTKTTPNTQQKPYGMLNRFKDIWNMLVDRITLWWYQSGMKSGKLTADQWKSVQNAAKRLGSNRTAMGLGKWWNPDKYNADFFGGLHSFTQNLPRLHELQALGSDEKLGEAKQLRYMAQHSPKLTSAVNWGYKYGYIPKEQYNSYHSGLTKYKAIEPTISRVGLDKITDERLASVIATARKVQQAVQQAKQFARNII